MAGRSPGLRVTDPQAGDGRGFVVVLPGGGYRELADHEGPPVAEWLEQVGIRAGVLDYTVNPAPVATVLDEVLTAVTDVRAGRYGAVEGPVGVLGFSAGGHLAGLAATATTDELGPGRRRPDAAVLAYPLVSMTERAHGASRDSLLDGVAPDEREARARELSVERRVDALTPPMFAWHTADDPGVSANHSLLLAQSMVDCGREIELHVYPHGAHGLGLAGPPGYDWREGCLFWLRAQGFGQP